jgi:hypothetical protein
MKRRIPKPRTGHYYLWLLLFLAVTFAVLGIAYLIGLGFTKG